jgi:hypothetical protein
MARRQDTGRLCRARRRPIEFGEIEPAAVFWREAFDQSAGFGGWKRVVE